MHTHGLYYWEDISVYYIPKILPVRPLTLGFPASSPVEGLRLHQVSVYGLM